MMRNLVTMGLSEIEKSVVKATYDDELPPKEKHCVFLTECTSDYELVALFDRRLTMPRWNVVFKTLIVLHRLSIEGHERFMKDLAANHHTFNLHSFFDTNIGAQDHQEFIAKYADYLAQKVYVYRLLGVSVERRPPTESKEWARKLSGFDLVKALPALSQQFDKILLCKPYGDSGLHMTQIPVSALSLLVKDAFRIYSTLTVLMLGVVDHYLELDAAQTKLILTVCQTFRSQNIRFKKWTTELADVGFSHDKLFPELVPIPDALFELLQDHINVKSGKAATAAAAGSASAPPKKAAAAAPAAGKKTAPAAAKKKPVKRQEEEEEDEEEEEEEKDAMDSSEDEEVKPVRKQVAKATIAKKPAAATAAPAVKPKKAAPAPPPEPEEEEEVEDEEEETEEERKARKAAKKARKEAKKAKKEAKKKKKQESSEESAEEEEEEEEEEAPKPKKSKAAVKKPSKQAAEEPDLFTVLSQQNQAAASSAASPAYAVPVSSNVFNPYPAAAAHQNAYGAAPYGVPAYQQPQQQQYGYGAPPAYGMAAGPGYGAPPSNSALAGLQPLSSQHKSRGSASFSPGEENTTAVGGIHDPNATKADPFSDLGPDLTAKPAKGKR